MSGLVLGKCLTYTGLALLLGGALMRRTRLAELPLGWLVAGFAALLLGAVSATGSVLLALGFSAPGDLADYLTTTRAGRATLLHLMGAALLLAAELQERRQPAWRALALLGGALALWGLAGAGHAAERGPFWTLLDALHAGAAAVWVGGVLALLRSRPTPATTHRFSGVALGCLTVLALSGAAATLAGLPLPLLWSALWGSSWGLLLLLKLGLIGAALLAAVWVRRALHGRVRAAKLHPLWLESALLLGVLGASGALSTTPRPTTAQIQRQTIKLNFTLDGQALSGELVLSGPGDAELSLRPALPGLRARLIMTDHPMPVQVLRLQASGDELQAQTRLWMSGHWVLALSSGNQTRRVNFEY
ncbi:hypothetical protein DKM44_08445 [Deinococcus irradiatisoli]|uniref:Copper resistance protein D domain-containing protein n=1 Tax=Deinococcus irradiatisoli TaxID=2202254 RepID=A0A2Z3JI28_9DEIO|nr:CopD family protein [Deinococcus irradiatisoli]AWN23251.1 hypothetical protein DKM44_08445 [Deinococcus irradiatisoli]